MNFGGGGKVAPSGGGLFGGVFNRGRNTNNNNNNTNSTNNDQLELERKRQEELIKEQLRALMEIDMEAEKKRQEELVQETVQRQQEEQEAKRLQEEAAQKRQEEEAAQKRQEVKEARRRQREEMAAKRKEARRLQAEEAARKKEEEEAQRQAEEEEEAIRKQLKEQVAERIRQDEAEAAAAKLQQQQQLQQQHAENEEGGGSVPLQNYSSVGGPISNPPCGAATEAATTTLPQSISPSPKLEEEKDLPPNNDEEPISQKESQLPTATGDAQSPEESEPPLSDSNTISTTTTTARTRRANRPNRAERTTKTTATTTTTQNSDNIVATSPKREKVKMALSQHLEQKKTDADEQQQQPKGRHGDEISIGTLELNKKAANKVAASARTRRARRPKSRASRQADRPWGGVVNDVARREGIELPVSHLEQQQYDGTEERDFFAQSNATIFEKSAFNFDFENATFEDDEAATTFNPFHSSSTTTTTTTTTAATNRIEEEEEGGEQEEMDKSLADHDDIIDLERLDILEQEEGQYGSTNVPNNNNRLSEKLTEKFENAWEEAQVDTKFVAELKALRGDKKEKSPSSSKKKSSKAKGAEKGGEDDIADDVPRLFLFESEKRKDKDKKKKKKKKKASKKDLKKEKEDTTMTKEFKTAMKNFFEPEVEEEYILESDVNPSFPTDGFAFHSDGGDGDDSSQSSVSVSSVESMGGFIRELREKSLKKSGTDDDTDLTNSQEDRSRSRKSRSRSSSRTRTTVSRSPSPANQSMASSSRRNRGRSPSGNSVASKRSVYTSSSRAGSARSGQLPPLGKGKASTPPLTTRPSTGSRRDRVASSDGSVVSSSSRYKHRNRRLASRERADDDKSTKSSVSRARTEAPSRRRVRSGTSVASSRRGSRSTRSAPAQNLLDPAEFYAREVKKQSSKKAYSTDGIKKELEDLKRQSKPTSPLAPPKLRPPKPQPFNSDRKAAKESDKPLDPFDRVTPITGATLDSFSTMNPSKDGFGLGTDSTFGEQQEQHNNNNNDGKKSMFGKVAASALIVSKLKAVATRAKQATELPPMAASDDMESGLLSP